MHITKDRSRRLFRLTRKLHVFLFSAKPAVVLLKCSINVIAEFVNVWAVFFIICHSEIWYDPCAIFRTYHDVFQLEISVNNARTVYKLESIGDVSRPSNYTSHGTRCLGQTRYIVPILENASHQVFFAKFHHKSYSQPFFFSNQCSTIEIYDEWIIQLPRKNLNSWITFSPMSLRQNHSFFHRLIVAKLWFHFVVKCFHFVSLL